MRAAAACLGVLMLIPVLIAAPARPVGNLLVNGSFEDGPAEVGEYQALDKGSEAVKGWKVTRGQIDLIGTFWVSAQGGRSLDLHGSPGYGGVAQTFKTRKGARYQVELQLAVTPGAGERGIWVEAAGEKKQFEAASGEATKEKMNWTKVTWEFTATGTETTLEIYSTEKGEANTGPAIDDVRVTEK